LKTLKCEMCEIKNLQAQDAQIFTEINGNRARKEGT